MNLKAIAIRQKIIERMEFENDLSDWQEYWKIDSEGRAIIGCDMDGGRWMKWRVVHPLSPELLKRYHCTRRAEVSDSPF